MDVLLAYYRQLLDHDTRAAEAQPIAEANPAPLSNKQKSAPITGVEGGWEKHEQVLQAAGDQDRKTAERRRGFEAMQGQASTKRSVEGAVLAIPERPVGRGATGGRGIAKEVASQKQVKLGTQERVPHRPTGFGPTHGALIIC